MPVERMWRSHDLKPSYDVVIVGAGVHGLAVGDRAHQPILAGLYHPPGGIIRHDAVVWGYARGVDRMGIEIHPFTEVTAIQAAGANGNGTRRVEGVVTNRGTIATRVVV